MILNVYMIIEITWDRQGKTSKICSSLKLQLLVLPAASGNMLRAERLIQNSKAVGCATKTTSWKMLKRSVELKGTADFKTIELMWTIWWISRDGAHE